MNHKLLFVFFISLNFFSAHSQDILFFKTGLEYKAKIVKMSESEVEYKNYFVQDEPLSIVELKDLISIKYENGKQLILDAKLFQTPPIKFVQQQSPMTTKKDPQVVVTSPAVISSMPLVTSPPVVNNAPPAPVNITDNTVQLNKLIEKVEKLQTSSTTASSNKEIVDAFKDVRKAMETLNTTSQQILESNQKIEGTLKAIKSKSEAERQENAESNKEDFAVRAFALGFTFESVYVLNRDEGGLFWGGNLHAVINFAKTKKVGFRLEPEINIAGAANESSTLSGSIGLGFYPVRNLNRVRVYGGPYFGVAFANSTPGIAFGCTIGGEYLVTKHFSLGLSTGYYGHFIVVPGVASSGGSPVEPHGVFRLANLNARFYF